MLVGIGVGVVLVEGFGIIGVVVVGGEGIVLFLYWSPPSCD